MNKDQDTPRKASYPEIYRDYLRKIEELSDEFSEFRDEWVDAEAPYKIGDIIPCQGHSYNGKPMQIESIGIRDGVQGRYEWWIHGVIMTKKGTPSNTRTRFRLKYKPPGTE